MAFVPVVDEHLVGLLALLLSVGLLSFQIAGMRLDHQRAKPGTLNLTIDTQAYKRMQIAPQLLKHLQRLQVTRLHGRALQISLTKILLGRSAKSALYAGCILCHLRKG